MSTFGNLYSNELNVKGSTSGSLVKIAPAANSTAYDLTLPGAAPENRGFLSQTALGGGALEWSENLKVAKGTVIAPSISFAADNSVGLYQRDGFTNEVSLSVGANERVRFTTTHVNVMLDTESGSKLNGAIITAGGLGVAKNANIGGNVRIEGNLQVQGTTTSIDSTNLNVTDKHIYLNKDWISTAAAASGIVVNSKLTSATNVITTGGFADGVTVKVAGSAYTFQAGDIVQITGAANQNNNGLFEVASYIGDALAINPAPTAKFCQTAFTADTTVQGAVGHVTVNHLFNDNGTWKTATGDNSADLGGTPLLSSGDSITIDADNINGEGLIVNNTQIQTGGDLVQINGDTGFNAVNVTAGDVEIAENLTVSGDISFGGLIRSMSALEVTDNLTVTKSISRFNTTGGALTVSLPTLASSQGKTYTIILEAGSPNSLTVSSPDGVSAIENGVGPFIMNADRQRVNLTAVDTMWLIL